MGIVPRRQFFAAQQRIAVTQKPNYIKKSAVQRGEEISKKNGEMSYNFGEIINKLYFLVSRKPARGLPTPSPPPLRKLPLWIFHVVDSNVRFAGSVFTRRIHSREERGEGRVICETMPFDNGSSDRLQIQQEDRQQYSAPLLFRLDLSYSYWRVLASFCRFIQ